MPSAPSWYWTKNVSVNPMSQLQKWSLPSASDRRRPADQPADPWEANSLEWATASPPPHHNFESIPPIRSERPVFDARMAATEVHGG